METVREEHVELPDLAIALPMSSWLAQDQQVQQRHTI